MSDKERRGGGGLVGPVILIGLGVVFLLNNLGVLEWSVWEVLLRLWPILLVATGLDLILGRRSIWGSLLALVLTFAVLGLALGISAGRGGFVSSPRGDEIVQPLGDAEQANLTIAPGIGRLRVESGAGSQNLVDGTVEMLRGEDLAQDFAVEGEEATFALRTERQSFGPFRVGWSGGRLWALRVTSQVPLQLEAELGLGEMELDLSGLDLEGLDVEVGLGQAVVRLPATGRFAGRIDGAIGRTVVVIPAEMEARLRLDTGLTGRQIPADFDCEGDVCTSPGYGAADQQVELELGQAIGSLVVRH